MPHEDKLATLMSGYKNALSELQSDSTFRDRETAAAWLRSSAGLRAAWIAKKLAKYEAADKKRLN